MSKSEKPAGKLWLIVLGSAAVFALAAILVTCKMFESPAVDAGPDWNLILKNSTWTLSQKNVDGGAVLAPALNDVSSVVFSEDLTMVIRYGALSFSAGKFVLGEKKNIRQAYAGGYVENELSFTFSVEGDNYLMTVNIKDAGTFNFFKN